MALIRRGQVIWSSERSRRYLVGQPLGAGGFGEASSGWLVDRSGRRRRRVCIKASLDGMRWHGESYFGHLLAGEARVVRLLDSFPWCSGTGRSRRMVFIAVFELEDQTVQDWFATGGTPWTEAGAFRELVALLGVLEKLHRMGATHRDITPENVYVAGQRRLKVGDFGLATHGRGGLLVSVSAFNPGFTPRSVRSGWRQRWYPSDDLYQLGLLTLMLLSGDLSWRSPIRTLRHLGLEPRLELVLTRAIGPRPERFGNATEVLDSLGGARWARVSVPSSVPIRKGMAKDTDNGTRSTRRLQPSRI